VSSGGRSSRFFLRRLPSRVGRLTEVLLIVPGLCLVFLLSLQDMILIRFRVLGVLFNGWIFPSTEPFSLSEFYFTLGLLFFL